MDTNSKSFWDYKPYWCQPWSIISFGILVLISSWELFNKSLITYVIGFFIFVWWILFLVLAPNLYEVTNDKK
tara:strand:+ start:737 stop:952 length:216 start_codon:yes stop_codon:yes gene_type:complete